MGVTNNREISRIFTSYRLITTRYKTCLHSDKKKGILVREFIEPVSGGYSKRYLT
jgi:hypothetical protein